MSLLGYTLMVSVPEARADSAAKSPIGRAIEAKTTGRKFDFDAEPLGDFLCHLDIVADQRVGRIMVGEGLPVALQPDGELARRLDAGEMVTVCLAAGGKCKHKHKSENQCKNLFHPKLPFLQFPAAKIPASAPRADL